MSILPIYLYGTDVLRKKAKPVHQVDDALVRQIMDMFETMRKAHGVGLAATQVGSMKRVIVIDVSEAEEAEGEEKFIKPVKPLALINPEILSYDGKSVVEEGCLSIPDVRDEVERAKHIAVRFRDTNFGIAELQAEGLLARIVLHEIDHLNGVLFLDHLSDAKRKLHKDALKKIESGEVEVPYPVVTAVPATV